MTGQSLRSPVFQLIYSALLDQPSADLCHQVKRIAVLVVDSDAQRLAMRLERGAIALAIMTGEVRLNCRGWHLELLCFVLLRAMAKYLPTLTAFPSKGPGRKVIMQHQLTHTQKMIFLFDFRGDNFLARIVSDLDVCVML